MYVRFIGRSIIVDAATGRLNWRKKMMETSLKRFIKKEKNKSSENELMTIQECSEKYGLTRQTIHLAITKNRLKATKIKNLWMIKDSDWHEYVAGKHNRLHSMMGDKPLYDPNAGRISPRMLSEIIGVDMNHIYFLLRKGIIPHDRYKSAYIIDKKTALAMKNIIKFRKNGTHRNS